MKSDLTVVTTYEGDVVALRDHADYLIRYASDCDIQLQWMIIATHEDSGQVIGATRPSSNLSLQIISVDNVRKVKPSYVNRLARAPQMTTVDELIRYLEPISA